MSIIKPSQALQAIFDARDARNSGRHKIIAKDLSSVVYIWTNPLQQPCAIAYCGRSMKPSFNYRYRSELNRANAVAEWMKSVSENSRSRREHKSEPRALEVGDILMASWGYDQTNIDYFLVTKLIGEAMVEIVEIGSMVEDSDMMGGRSAPDPTRIIGEPLRRRAVGKRVKVSSCVTAFKEEPKVIAGCKIYTTHHYSNTH
jgi:hypothetical protein